MKDETRKKTIKTPLILEQSPQNIKGIQPLPYEFESDTYELFSNQKNPFLGRILSKGKPPIDLDLSMAFSLFHKIGKNEGYGPNYPGRESPHRKRNILVDQKVTKQSKGYESENELPGFPIKLKSGIEAFFIHTLSKLRKDQNQLPQMVNDLVPLFVQHEVLIRVFPAYREFQNFEQLLDTLEKISEDTEVENFELFCSALFGYYNKFG